MMSDECSMLDQVNPRLKYALRFFLFTWTWLPSVN
jgi:hypothetical protein